MSGRRVFGVVWIALALFNAGFAFYGGKPWLAAIWALVLITAVTRTVGDWNKPLEAFPAHPLRTQLTFGAILLACVALWWFSRAWA